MCVRNRRCRVLHLPVVVRAEPNLAARGGIRDLFTRQIGERCLPCRRPLIEARDLRRDERRNQPANAAHRTDLIGTRLNRIPALDEALYIDLYLHMLLLCTVFSQRLIIA